jgi:hypothetical protein
MLRESSSKSRFFKLERTIMELRRGNWRRASSLSCALEKRSQHCEYLCCQVVDLIHLWKESKSRRLLRDDPDEEFLEERFKTTCMTTPPNDIMIRTCLKSTFTMMSTTWWISIRDLIWRRPPKAPPCAIVPCLTRTRSAVEYWIARLASSHAFLSLRPKVWWLEGQSSIIVCWHIDM